jgi:radial spoke head protein 4A
MKRLTRAIETSAVPSWSSRVCSKLSPIKFSPVTLRSLRWPGASVLAYNDKFANIYIGDGLKDGGEFAPPSLGKIEKEFVLDEANADVLFEQIDPTVEAETAFEDSKKTKDEEGKEGGAEGEEGAEDAEE